MQAVEINFDGLVGPTHHYGGLALGNLASQQHAHQVSQPRAAALQGLRKMKALHDRGIRQAVLPPHDRPHWGFLQAQGFTGKEQEIIAAAGRQRPDLLSIAYSASAMWAANAATVSPSADTADGRVHITPANLISTPHRALEPEFTSRILKTVFSCPDYFCVHDTLPASAEFADEGGANHVRLTSSHGLPGYEVFVYGRTAAQPATQFPARQTLLAAERIATLHGLAAGRTLFCQQNPAVIDVGVFHNDVISVANENVWLCHEAAYVDHSACLGKLIAEFEQSGRSLHVFQVSKDELSVAEAVRTYLFNSQLVTLPQGGMLLLCPAECAESAAVERVLQRLISDLPQVRDIQFIDVRQSMRNGGGPACLRLRVVLTAAELKHVHCGVLFTTDLYGQLLDWVQRRYRETLAWEDLADPGLIDETRRALDELTQLLQLGTIYAFQKP